MSARSFIRRRVFEPLTGTTTSGETVLGGAVHSFNPQGQTHGCVLKKANAKIDRTASALLKALIGEHGGTDYHVAQLG